MNHRIYAYYTDVGCDGQLELIDLWKERWKREGWEPIILGEDDAKKDPRWEAMKEKAKNFPCRQGAKNFERANFERWLAFAQIDGAVTDYDVFPRVPFPPQEFRGFVCGDGCGGPGFIVGTKIDFSFTVDVILSYEVQSDDIWDSQPHICDMRVLQKNKGIYDRILHNIACFGEKGWEERPLVHFGNASLDAYTNCFKDKTKADAVRELIELHYQPSIGD